MGGFGSGRKSRFGTRPTVEGCLNIDVRQWAKLGYCHPEAAIATNGKITQAIAWTDCNYGGQRPWFVCSCGRRSAKLYKNPNIFRQTANYHCRQCLNLTYSSCNASGDPQKTFDCRYVRIARQLKVRPVQYGFMLPPFPIKPKGMHDRTYQRLARKFSQYSTAFYREQLDRLNRLQESLQPKIIISRSGVKREICYTPSLPELVR